MSAERKSRSSKQPIQPTFQQVLEALRDNENSFKPRYLYRFSDIDEEELRQLDAVWPQVSARRRQAILEDIEELGETNYTLSFEDFCRYTLSDNDPHVRELSIRALWEYDNSGLVPLFLDMMANDSETAVRAAAAAALGKYVYLGEIEEISEVRLNEIVDQLVEVYRSPETTHVRRKALESLGYSSRDEITGIIESAFGSGSRELMVSAIFAMGRSANAQWGAQVLEMLESDDLEMRYEAVRAAGELELKPAITVLVNLLDESDNDIRLAAIWSLSQIGGEGIQEVLEQLYDEAEDEEEAEFIDLALENLMFTEDMEAFSLFEISPDGAENGKDDPNDYDEFEIDFDEDE